jgi:hypothetical protein
MSKKQRNKVRYTLYGVTSQKTVVVVVPLPHLEEPEISRRSRVLENIWSEEGEK